MVSLGDEIFTVSSPPDQETAWPLSLSSEAEKTSGKERDGAKKILHVQGSPAKLGSQERRKAERGGSQVRREGNVWRTGLLAMLLSAVRKTFKMGGEVISATKLSKSTVLCLHANSGGESNGQAAKP